MRCGSNNKKYRPYSYNNITFNNTHINMTKLKNSKINNKMDNQDSVTKHDKTSKRKKNSHVQGATLFAKSAEVAIQLIQ